MYWMFLLLAISCDVMGTTCLKASNGFTKLIPSILVLASYALILPLFAVALKRIDVSVAYAMWSGIGTVAIAIIGFVLFKEQMNPVKIAAITMIIVGVLALNLSGVTR